MELKKKIESLFEELGFKKVRVNSTTLFLHSGIYYKVTFIKGLKSYVIEFANSYDEANNNVFEDGDLYSMSMNEDELIKKLRHDLVNYYIN
ncbi:hypothetical protein [Lysinibacillus sp. NPDC059133]|uniref:hypothetical protein n=1 Tax=Lysinibacillus sp. NPDC059133 TaxID=3346737 RepID=UPI0036987C97